MDEAVVLCGTVAARRRNVALERLGGATGGAAGRAAKDDDDDDDEMEQLLKKAQHSIPSAHLAHKNTRGLDGESNTDACVQVRKKNADQLKGLGVVAGKPLPNKGTAHGRTLPLLRRIAASCGGCRDRHLPPLQALAPLAALPLLRPRPPVRGARIDSRGRGEGR
jgi:hypothetical protein